MNQIAVLLVLGLVFGTNVALGAGPMEAFTSEGKKVILKPDGTWTYAQETKSVSDEAGVTKPETATKRLVSSKGFVEIWYDPKKWTPGTSNNPAQEFYLIHSSGDAFAVLIPERLAMPIETLKNAVLANAKQVAPDTSSNRNKK